MSEFNFNSNDASLVIAALSTLLIVSLKALSSRSNLATSAFTLVSNDASPAILEDSSADTAVVT